MTTLLDVLSKKTEDETYGIKINLKLPRISFYHFRIAFGNLFSKNTRDGATLSNGNINLYSSEIKQQLEEYGYHVVELNDIWTKDCFYSYLNPKDENEKYPRMKVYIHPNEITGWAPKKDFDNLLEIAKSNSFVTNIQTAFFYKVYNIDDENYLKILHDSEEEILAWLIEYRKHHKNKVCGAAEAFGELYGIKRISLAHLNFRDYVVENYLNKLAQSFNNC